MEIGTLKELFEFVCKTFPHRYVYTEVTIGRHINTLNPDIKQQPEISYVLGIGGLETFEAQTEAMLLDQVKSGLRKRLNKERSTVDQAFKAIEALK